MKTTKLLLALFLAFSLLFPLVSFAQGMGPRGGMGYGRGPGAGPMMATEMWTAKLETLAELTGKSLEEIKKEVGNKPFYVILEENKVDQEKFHTLLRAKMFVAIDKSVADKKITEDQAKFMKERMENMPFGPNSRSGKGKGYGPRGGGWGWGNCPWGAEPDTE